MISNPSFSKLTKLLIEVYEKLCVFLFSLMVAVGILRVVSRQVSFIDAPIATPLATNLLVITIFFGAGLVQLREKHIKITYFRTMIHTRGKRAKQRYEQLIIVLNIFVISLIMVGTVTMTLQRWETTLGGGQDLPILTQGHIYLLFLIGLFISLIYLLKKFTTSITTGDI